MIYPRTYLYLHYDIRNKFLIGVSSPTTTSTFYACFTDFWRPPHTVWQQFQNVFFIQTPCSIRYIVCGTSFALNHKNSLVGIVYDVVCDAARKSFIILYRYILNSKKYLYFFSDPRFTMLKSTYVFCQLYLPALHQTDWSIASAVKKHIHQNHPHLCKQNIRQLHACNAAEDINLRYIYIRLGWAERKGNV